MVYVSNLVYVFRFKSLTFLRVVLFLCSPEVKVRCAIEEWVFDAAWDAHIAHGSTWVQVLAPLPVSAFC